LVFLTILNIVGVQKREVIAAFSWPDQRICTTNEAVWAPNYPRTLAYLLSILFVLCSWCIDFVFVDATEHCPAYATTSSSRPPRKRSPCICPVMPTRKTIVTSAHLEHHNISLAIL
jgi:hypothetical protein